jgi:acyl dehydratase
MSQQVASKVVQDPDDLVPLVGERLGESPWVTVRQREVDLFAEATGDHQWIHVDPEQAKSGPFGTTIAHGFLTLSLAPALLGQVLEVAGASFVINYGLNKVRFPAPVPTGSNVRMAVDLNAADPVEGGIQAALGLTFELEGQPKPACVGEMVIRYLR